MRELGVNLPPPKRSYGDETSVLGLIRKTGGVEIDLATLGLVVQRVVHYTTAAPGQTVRILFY